MADDSLEHSSTQRRSAWKWADTRDIPLRTIVATVVVVALAYLAAITLYRLRSLLVLLLVGSFIALLLNPIVGFIESKVHIRRGYAVGLVSLLVLVVFAGLAFAFGYPLVRSLTHLADTLPQYVRDAQTGHGWVGRLLRRYHAEKWVNANAGKLISLGQGLSRPALALGRGAFSMLLELLTIFTFVVLVLLQAPKMRAWVLDRSTPPQAERLQRLGGRVSRAATSYMAGNLITSIVAGLVVFVTLWLTGVPFAALFGLWVALVDFLPTIGGALAGIPTVLFAFAHSSSAGVITLVAFMVYTQIENHILNPLVMSRAVKINSLSVFMAVILGAEIGSWVGGLFGGLVGVLLAIPAAATLQAIAEEVRRTD